MPERLARESFAHKVSGYISVFLDHFHMDGLDELTFGLGVGVGRASSQVDGGEGGQGFLVPS